MLGIGLLDSFISLILFIFTLMLWMQHAIVVKKQTEFIRVNLQNNLERIWVQSLLRDKIHQAGYTPCINMQHLKIYDHRQPGAVVKPIVTHPQLKISYMRYPVRTHQQWIMISDCFHAEIVSHNALRLRQFKYNYPKGYYEGAWIEEKFYVKNNKLYYESEQHTEQLISGISSMQTKIFRKQDYLWSEITLRFVKENIDFKTRVWSW
jgi:hypothetical protein